MGFAEMAEEDFVPVEPLDVPSDEFLVPGPDEPDHGDGFVPGVAEVEVHWAQDESIRLADSSGSLRPGSQPALSFSPPWGTLSWVRVPAGWSVWDRSGKPSLLFPGGEGEPVWVPVPDI